MMTHEFYPRYIGTREKADEYPPIFPIFSYLTTIHSGFYNRKS